MTSDRLTARLPMRRVPGYGSDAEAAARIERGLDTDETSGRISALRIPFESDNGPVILKGVRGVSLPTGGISTTELAGVEAGIREALGGLFFLYVNPDGVLRVGPRRPTNIPRPICYMMSHGIVMLDAQIMQSGINPPFVAENLPGRSLLMLGRSGSNHDRLIFTRQATSLVSRLLVGNAYRKIDVAVDFRADALQPQ